MRTHRPVKPQRTRFKVVRTRTIETVVEVLATNQAQAVLVAQKDLLDGRYDSMQAAGPDHFEVLPTVAREAA